MDATLIQQIVRKKEDFLRRHLVLSDSVVEKLWDLDVIGEYAWKQMVADRGNSERQMNMLMTALKFRGLEAFKTFLEVLRKTFHGWLADDIAGSTVELESEAGNGKKTTIYVSDILSGSYQSRLAGEQISFIPAVANKTELPVLPYFLIDPPSLYSGSGFSNKRERRRRKRKSRHVPDLTNPDEFNPYEVLSPISRAPENIRFLQQVFDKEQSNAKKSMSVLRNEENTIKSLLQQNIREQYDVLDRQDALRDIGDRFWQINKRALQLYKPKVNPEHSRSRLRHLQRMHWSDDEE